MLASAPDAYSCTFRLAPDIAVQQGIACLASTLTNLFLGIPLDALLYGGACHLQPVTLQVHQYPAQNGDLAAAVASLQIRQQNACSGLLLGILCGHTDVSYSSTAQSRKPIMPTSRPCLDGSSPPLCSLVLALRV